MRYVCYIQLVGGYYNLKKAIDNAKNIYVCQKWRRIIPENIERVLF